MPSHILVLNWNSGTETTECLQNLVDCKVRAKFVVADNASSDDSVTRVLSWAESHSLRTLRVHECEVESYPAVVDDYDLVIIQNAANHGFAGGNNTAIRFAASRCEDGFVWLLNNDARINELTLPAIVARFSQDPQLGFVGSVIRYYERPDALQCYGGCVIHPRIGKRALYGKNQAVQKLDELDEREIDYLMGASLAIRPEVIDDIGVMEHAYFMYAEEMDWQLRARNKGWRIGVAKDSHIFHKGAASTQGRSHMYHYYLNRASVMFSTRFFGRASLATVAPSLFAIVALQNWRTPRNVFFGWKGIVEGALFRWLQTHPFPLKNRS